MKGRVWFAENEVDMQKLVKSPRVRVLGIATSWERVRQILKENAILEKTFDIEVGHEPFMGCFVVYAKQSRTRGAERW